MSTPLQKLEDLESDKKEPITVSLPRSTIALTDKTVADLQKRSFPQMNRSQLVGAAVLYYIEALQEQVAT